MGFRRVLRGVGKGSIFGHGRVFGVHNLLDSAENKCQDPFINIRTLAKLLKSEPKLKPLVSANLITRWKTKFDITELHDFIKYSWKEFSETDFPVVRTEHRGEEHSENQMIADILKEVASNSDVSGVAIAHIISFLTAKRGRDILIHQKGHLESRHSQEAYERAYNEWYSSGIDPAHTSFPGVPEEYCEEVFVVDEKDRFVWFYLDPEINCACELILKNPKEKQDEILVEMRSFNRELAGKIMDRIPETETLYR